jgi:hypothetical protein
MKGSGSSPSTSPRARRKRVVPWSPHGGLEIGPIQGLAEGAPEFTIETDVGLGIRQTRDLGQVRTQGEGQIDLGADALDQTTDLGDVRPAIEATVAGPDQVHARPVGAPGWPRPPGAAASLGPKLVPEPGHRPIGGLPLVLVDGARQEAPDLPIIRHHAPANHLGDGARDHHRRQGLIQAGVGALQGLFGAGLAEFFLAEAGDHDGSLPGWQGRPYSAGTAVTGRFSQPTGPSIMTCSPSMALKT